mmetsp:Transcript_39588/g.77397  ORF Transcript_39588/g.77397 Transcript_39588/m.77397 type:complete len:449 (+) Transcript_39588:54-1400(+)
MCVLNTLQLETEYWQGQGRDLGVLDDPQPADVEQDPAGRGVVAGGPQRQRRHGVHDAHPRAEGGQDQPDAPPAPLRHPHRARRRAVHDPVLRGVREFVPQQGARAGPLLDGVADPDGGSERDLVLGKRDVRRDGLKILRGARPEQILLREAVDVQGEVLSVFPALLVTEEYFQDSFRKVVILGNIYALIDITNKTQVDFFICFQKSLQYSTKIVLLWIDTKRFGKIEAPVLDTQGHGTLDADVQAQKYPLPREHQHLAPAQDEGGTRAGRGEDLHEVGHRTLRLASVVRPAGGPVSVQHFGPRVQLVDGGPVRPDGEPQLPRLPRAAGHDREDAAAFPVPPVRRQTQARRAVDFEGSPHDDVLPAPDDDLHLLRVPRNNEGQLVHFELVRRDARSNLETVERGRGRRLFGRHTGHERPLSPVDLHARQNKLSRRHRCPLKRDNIVPGV